MAKILLLDDSPVMHRVVRLTFADDARVEISVVRNPPEAEQALSMGQPELVIAYVRFPGSVDLPYFQSIRRHSPLILLLAESEENLDNFVAAGFNAILRKPFHSDELRLAVEGLLAGSQGESTNVVIAGRSAPLPPNSMTPPSPPPRLSGMASAAPSSRPPAAPPSSFPPKAAAAPVTHSAIPPRPPSFPPVSSEATLPGVAAPSASPQQSASLDEPQITMNLSFFKKPPALPQKGGATQGENEISIQPESQAPFFDVGAPSTLEVPSFQAVVSAKSQAPSFDVPVSQTPRSSVGATHQQQRVIEPAPWSSEPLSLEDVMVSTRAGNSSLSRHEVEKIVEESVASAVSTRIGNSGISRREVEKIVEDSVASALSNAVRQALNETLPDLRQALVNEVSQRAVTQLSAELQSIKISLRENMLSEVRDLSAQWLRRETPNLAKDVIREEIRKVIEQI